MEKAEENPKKSYAEIMKEAAAKYGVAVTDMSERGGIGIVGGIASKQRKTQNLEPNDTIPEAKPKTER